MSRPTDQLTRWGQRAATAGRGSSMVAASALGAIAGSSQRARRVFRERYPTVAVTGMTGVGKTKLVDRLSGHTTRAGSVEVGSAVMERRTRRAGLRGFRFRVVPGENAATRLGALDAVFHDEPVDGVLHVVANGYATGRRMAGISGSAEVTREQQLARELEDWMITAHRIASMAVRRDHPTWLIIAVTKADEVTRSYSPGSGTPFGDRLDELRALAGAAKLSVDVLPVCAVPGGRAGALSGRQGEEYLTALAARMAQLSGHV
jgi:hypothetical protein